MCHLSTISLKSILKIPHLLLLLGAFCTSSAAVDISIMHGRTVKTWKDMRDENIVRQGEDYSCGSASLATLLTYFYGDTVTEAEILKAIDRKDAASFADLQRVAESYGYNSVGMAAKLEHLFQLKVPAVLFLRIRGLEHFTVFRGINRDHVLLADPSWGNKKISLSRFLKMWKTIDKDGMYGRMLLVMPKKSVSKSTNPLFMIEPENTNNLIQGLTGITNDVVTGQKKIFP